LELRWMTPWKWQRTQRFDATEGSRPTNNLARPSKILTPSGSRLIVSFGAGSSVGIPVDRDRSFRFVVTGDSGSS